MPNKPEHVFKVGPVRASIFNNTFQRDGKDIVLPKVVLEVRYKDKNGQWKGTNSFSLNELPKAILALEKSFDHLTTHRDTAPGPYSSEASDPRDSSAVVEKI